MLEKPKLFLNAKEFWFTVAVFLSLLLFRLYVIYGEYRVFIDKPFYFTHVEVLQQYKKEKKDYSYMVLRVYSPSLDFNFFTRTYRDEDYLNKTLRLKLFPSTKMSFWDYLGSSFISSKINSISEKPEGWRSWLSVKIASQHSDSLVANFYQAIFLATPLQKELREEISKLGVSHLIALSGFHLAILWGVLFTLFRPLYRFFQQRYFPYRFDLIDVGFLVLIVLGWYVWFVESPASLLRSYSMMVIGWMLLVLGVELLSFSFLTMVVLMLLLVFPKMILSLAFWFSVLGVFYIFLLLKRFSELNKFYMMLIISFGIFILMSPIVHMIFPLTTLSQLYSPLLSFAFTLFYPLVILLHLVGFGNLFDTALLDLFSLDSDTVAVELDILYGVIYLIVSIGAIFSRWIFYLLFALAVGFMGWMFIGFWVLL